VGERAPGRRSWRRISTLFVVIQNVILSRNFDQSMFKNAYFFGKIATTYNPSVVTPAYYYNFVEFVSGAACYFPLKKEQNKYSKFKTAQNSKNLKT